MNKEKPRKPTAPAKSEGEKYPRKAVQIKGSADESPESQMQKFAGLITSPDFAAYRVINGVEGKSGLESYLDVPALMETLRDEAKAVNNGDLKRAEAMLMNQATALQSLFSRLAERGMGCDNLAPFESNMRMALRAQNQCRATLETLATIKNPPVLFAKQANVTTGPQQINNGTAAPSRTREIENGQSQLSGGDNELLPDARASALASEVNPALEAVGKINRAEVARG